MTFVREAKSFLRHWTLTISSFSVCHLSNACHKAVFAFPWSNRTYMSYTGAQTLGRATGW